MNYGKEMILDLHECNVDRFNRKDITAFFAELCDRIEMEAADLHFWDDVDTLPGEKQTEPHLVGTSAIQFILTSNITIHTLDLLGRVYLNIFSCKDFDTTTVHSFCVEFFGGRVVGRHVVDRI